MATALQTVEAGKLIEVEPELDRMIREWELWLIRNLSEATLKAYTQGFEVFREWFKKENPDMPINLARARHLEEWRHSMKEKGLAKSTINLWLTATKSFWVFMIATLTEETNTLIPNPMASVRGLKTKRNGNGRHKRDRLTSSEIEALFVTCHGVEPKHVRDRAILSLMAFGALRTIEIHRADSDDARTDGDVRIFDVMGKGEIEKSDFIVLHPNAEKALDQWMEIRGPKSGALFTSLSKSNFGDRLSTRSIRATIKERFKIAGITGSRKSVHSLRHSAITSAIEGGGQPLAVMAMARHSSFDTTMGYYHNASRTKEPAEFLIDYDFDLFDEKA